MSVNTNKWVKFFSEAGLPSNVATNYAIIFTDHRIQNDMLIDITKEILYDMGIKTMGDVIAILRHAKSVHHETTREKMLGNSHNQVGSTSRTTLPNTKRLSQPILSRLKPNSQQISTQNTSSALNTISLKRSAESSVKPMAPKIRRIITSEDQDLNEDSNDGQEMFGTNKMLGLESLKISSPKTSVFSRLGNEKNSDKNSSIFLRLGNNSSAETLSPKRRVTIGGNGINSNRETNNNIIKTNLLMKKTVRNITPVKKLVLPPMTGGLRSAQKETLSVKNRIGMNSSSNIIPTANRLVVNRSIGSSLTANRSLTSQSVAQTKRIAMRRAAGLTNNKTISLRKNIFDRLGPISL